MGEYVINESRKAVMIVWMYSIPYSNAAYVYTHHNQLERRISSSDRTSAVSTNLGAKARTLDYQAFNYVRRADLCHRVQAVKFKPWTKKKVEETK